MANNSYTYQYPSVKVTDDKGKVVYDGIVPVWRKSSYDDSQICLLDLSLDQGSYKVEPYDIPEGFEYNSEYTLDMQHPLLDLRLKSKLIEDGELTAIEQGYVMPNIIIDSLNNGSTTLGKLLEENDIVVFSFFRNGCIYCQKECEIFKKIYTKYKGRMTLVLFDTQDDAATTMRLVKSESWYGSYADEFYVVCDKENDQIYRKLATNNGVPRNVFIDKNGYVFCESGGLTEDWFERILYFNLFALMPA